MSDDFLPGIAPEEWEKPKSPAELKREEELLKVYDIYIRTGSEAAVKKHLNTKNPKIARAWINRANEMYGQDRREQGKAIFEMISQKTLEYVLRMYEHDTSEGTFANGDRFLRGVERIAKLYGLEREEDKQPAQTFVIGGDLNVNIPPGADVIEARDPWDRPGWVEDAEVVEVQNDEGPPKEP